MHYKHQRIKKRANATTNTHYRSWKKGKSWCYGFGTLAVLAGGVTLFQEEASADEVTVTVTNPSEPAVAATDPLVVEPVNESTESSPETVVSKDEQNDLTLADSAINADEQSVPEHVDTKSPQAAEPAIPEQTETPAEVDPIVPELTVSPESETEETKDQASEVPVEEISPTVSSDSPLVENEAPIEADDNAEQTTFTQVPEVHSENSIPVQAPSPQSAQAAIPPTGVWGDITWVYDAATQTLRFTSSGTIPGAGVFPYVSRPWMTQYNGDFEIRKIVFEQPVKAPANSAGLFSRHHALEELEGFEKIDTSAATSMKDMFMDCPNLTNLNGLSSWDVSNVSNMENMFRHCSSLADLSGISNWNVSRVTSMSWMFAYCASFQDLSALSSWNVSQVNDMSSMFLGCTSLTNPNGLSNWDTSNLQNMGSIFSDCSSLTTLDGLSNWDVSGLSSMQGLFWHCPLLTDLSGISDWDVSSVTDMGGLFEGCTSLSDLSSLSNWNVSRVTRMGDFFSDCTSLTSLTGLSNWDVSSVEDMSSMFFRCTSLSDISALLNWNVSKVDSMGGMFYECSSLTELNGLSNWDVSSVHGMNEMFAHCTELQNADALNNWPVSDNNDLNSMFYNCSNLQSLGLGNWKIILDAEGFEGMFEGCAQLRSITLGKDSIWPDGRGRYVYLPEVDTGSGEYTGEWIGLNTGRVYSSSDDLMNGYDGSFPDTYVWRKRLTAAVNYDANGGDSSSVPASETSSFAQGDTADVIVSPAIPVRDEDKRANYEFIGWNTKADGSGTFYQAGDIMAFDSDITLYAQWKENLKSSSVTVRYVGENGNEIAKSVEIIGTIDDAYATHGLSGDQLVNGNVFYLLTETPENASGTYTAEGIVVTYVYKAVGKTAPEPAKPESPEDPVEPATALDSDPADTGATPIPEDKPIMLTYVSAEAPVFAPQAEMPVTKTRVLPNTGSKGNTAAILSGTVSLLGAGVGMAIRLKKRRKN